MLKCICEDLFCGIEQEKISDLSIFCPCSVDVLSIFCPLNIGVQSESIYFTRTLIVSIAYYMAHFVGLNKPSRAMSGSESPTLKRRHDGGGVGSEGGGV